MTVAIPEASTAARAGSARGAARRAPARQSRPTEAQMGRPGPRGAAGSTGPRGQQGRTRPAAEPQRRERPERKRPEGKRKRSAAADRLTGASTKPGSALHNYQAIIAAEYVAATLLVALSPIATRKAQPSVATGKLSPYVPGDIVKLLAIGIVYLILEGMAAGPRGLARFSAWFGFLIMLGVGLSEASRIADIFKMLAGGGIHTTVLTGAQAPAKKGSFTVPALGQGAGTGGSTAGEGGGGPVTSSSGFVGGT